MNITVTVTNIPLDISNSNNPPSTFTFTYENEGDLKKVTELEGPHNYITSYITMVTNDRIIICFYTDKECIICDGRRIKEVLYFL